MSDNMVKTHEEIAEQLYDELVVPYLIEDLKAED